MQHGVVVVLVEHAEAEQVGEVDGGDHLRTVGSSGERRVSRRSAPTGGRRRRRLLTVRRATHPLHRKDRHAPRIHRPRRRTVAIALATAVLVAGGGARRRRDRAARDHHLHAEARLLHHQHRRAAPADRQLLRRPAEDRHDRRALELRQGGARRRGEGRALPRARPPREGRRRRRSCSTSTTPRSRPGTTRSRATGPTTRRRTPTYVTGELFPAVPGMVQLVKAAKAHGYAVFFLTGRPTTQEAATLGNLTASDTVGLDAGYPTPTDPDGTGRGRPLHEAGARRRYPPTSRRPAAPRSPARRSSTSRRPGSTSSRSATTSSRTSATSTATSRAARRTRPSSCRTRTTTCPDRALRRGGVPLATAERRLHDAGPPVAWHRNRGCPKPARDQQDHDHDPGLFVTGRRRPTLGALYVAAVGVFAVLLLCSVTAGSRARSPSCSSAIPLGPLGIVAAALALPGAHHGAVARRWPCSCSRPRSRSPPST